VDVKPALRVAYLVTIPKSVTATFPPYPLLQQGVQSADVVVDDETDDLWHARRTLDELLVVGPHGDNYDTGK
jgi:hypothetical protein